MTCFWQRFRCLNEKFPMVAPMGLLLTRHYRKHVIYSNYSRLLLSVSRRAGITQDSKYELESQKVVVSLTCTVLW
jgi:hypothetical protein